MKACLAQQPRDDHTPELYIINLMLQSFKNKLYNKTYYYHYYDCIGFDGSVNILCFNLFFI